MGYFLILRNNPNIRSSNGSVMCEIFSKELYQVLIFPNLIFSNPRIQGLRIHLQ